VRRTLVLAWPVILSRVGMIAMTTMDVVVLGRAGADQLAYYVLGYAIIDSLIAVTAGLQLGVPVLTARALGEGKLGAVAAIWRRGLLFAGVSGMLIVIVMQFAPQIFAATGQSEDLAREGGRVSAMLALSIPFFGLFIVSAMFLEALERPFLATIAVAFANVFNLLLSICLVFGVDPFPLIGGFHIPALGAWGCALATVITTAGLGIGLCLFVRFKLKDRALYGLTGEADADGVPDLAEQRKLGYAAGASYGLEAVAFSVLTLFAGFIGVLGLASFGVLFQFLALTFMTSFGIAAATQVRVGNAWGRGDARGMSNAGWAGFGVSVVLSSLFSGVYLTFPAFFAGLFTNDEAVLALTLPVMFWMVLVLITDGGQAVLNHACRGRGDTWVPTMMHVVSYWLIMLPAAWYFTFTLGRGTIGLFQGILVASVFSAFVLGLRFAVISRRGLPTRKPET
jgi:multidrug resistance protein, MATE family